ncbi:MAG: hypothetical protein JSS50_01885 [Proteobacteria bacterium]|nr:hypothetical protein [Pseudomonadota bacterium]
MLDLLNLFEVSTPELAKLLPKIKKSRDDKMVQMSFELSQGTQVVFVNNITQRKEISDYDSLATIELTQTEQEIFKKRLESLEQASGFYDGNQLLIKEAVCEDNTVYLEALRCKFSLMKAITTHAFPPDSAICKLKVYKTGALVPFITSDNCTAFIERKADKLYSAASGFLELTGDIKSLSGIVQATAESEACDEFLYDQNRQLRVGYQFAGIASMSLRRVYDASESGTLEFITPFFLNCSSKELEYILRTNSAPDKHEHTNNFYIVPLDTEGQAMKTGFLEKKVPGAFLYNPILASISKMV